MENSYWIDRKRAAMAMARSASTAEARLIHYDLAGRYSIKAVMCPPFMLPRGERGVERETAALQLPLPGTALPPSSPQDPGKFWRRR